LLPVTEKNTNLNDLLLPPIPSAKELEVPSTAARDPASSNIPREQIQPFLGTSVSQHQIKMPANDKSTAVLERVQRQKEQMNHSRQIGKAYIVSKCKNIA
jgi:hypothetical protein